MARAREAILAHGGALRANVFTRILLAQFGETLVANVPTMPVELILLPRWFPIHLSRMSYWARTVIVPLAGAGGAAAAGAQSARRAHPGTVRARPARRRRRRRTHQKRGWALFFNGLDRVLKVVEPFWPKAPAPPRHRALRGASSTERLNGEDGLGAIYPAMAKA